MDGLLLLVGVVGYFVYNVQAAGHEPEEVRQEFDSEMPAQYTWWWDLGVLTFGFGGVVVGAHVLVVGALQIAQAYEVPEVVIGLTLVAVGTSLPELATSVLAALRGNGDIAVGNAVGSSIVNILGVLGPRPWFSSCPPPFLPPLNSGSWLGWWFWCCPYFGLISP